MIEYIRSESDGIIYLSPLKKNRLSSIFLIKIYRVIEIIDIQYEFLNLYLKSLDFKSKGIIEDLSYILNF